MEDSWADFKKVDFSDESILQYHIDTRDFGCAIDKAPATFDKLRKDIPTLTRYQSAFFFSADEIRELTDRLFVQTGGPVKWRYLSFVDRKNPELSSGWALKYIRIYRTDHGLVISNSQNNHFYRKDFFENPLDRDQLNAH